MSEARKAICGSPDREQVHVMIVHLDAKGDQVAEHPRSVGGLTSIQAETLFGELKDAVDGVIDAGASARR